MLFYENSEQAGSDRPAPKMSITAANASFPVLLIPPPAKANRACHSKQTAERKHNEKLGILAVAGMRRSIGRVNIIGELNGRLGGGNLVP